jgi:hypothetical protein
VVFFTITILLTMYFIFVGLNFFESDILKSCLPLQCMCELLHNHKTQSSRMHATLCSSSSNVLMEWNPNQAYSNCTTTIDVLIVKSSENARPSVSSAFSMDNNDLTVTIAIATATATVTTSKDNTSMRSNTCHHPCSK